MEVVLQEIRRYQQRQPTVPTVPRSRPVQENEGEKEGENERHQQHRCMGNRGCLIEYKQSREEIKRRR